MSKPLHTRPFDMSAAIAGAPISLACGWPVNIIKYDMKDGKSPILGLYGDQDQIGRWTADGTFLGGGHSSLGLVMTPLGYLDGEPVWWDSSLVSPGGHPFKVAEMSISTPVSEYVARCRWPVPPKVYPVTGMTAEEIEYKAEEFTRRDTTWTEDERDFASFAIRHFIDNLTVLPDDCALRAKLIEMGWTAPKEVPF